MGVDRDGDHELEKVSTWADPAEFVATVRRAYRKDHWAIQPNRVEVWSEKGTCRGTLAPVLHALGVGFRVMHGFAPATIVHEIAEMYGASNRPFIPLYVGDWDPSGLYMSEVDLPARLARYGGAAIEVKRIALTPTTPAGSRALERTRSGRIRATPGSVSGTVAAAGSSTR